MGKTPGNNVYNNLKDNDEDNGHYLSQAQRDEIKKTPGNDLIVGLDDHEEYKSDDDVIGDDMQTAGYIGAPLSPQGNEYNDQQIQIPTEDNKDVISSLEYADDDEYEEYDDNEMNDNMVTIGAPLSPQGNDSDYEYYEEEEENYEDEYYEDDTIQ